MQMDHFIFCKLISLETQSEKSFSCYCCFTSNLYFCYYTIKLVTLNINKRRVSDYFFTQVSIAIGEKNGVNKMIFRNSVSIRDFLSLDALIHIVSMSKMTCDLKSVTPPTGAHLHIFFASQLFS